VKKKLCVTRGGGEAVVDRADPRRGEGEKRIWRCVVIAADKMKDDLK
jgi:hypothetical protein